MESRIHRRGVPGGRNGTRCVPYYYSTYANVPPGFWVQELFDLARNPYDRLGHFAQGSCRR